MGIAVELHMDKKMDDAMFERMTADCGGHFEEKGMHEVIFAVTMRSAEEDGRALLERLGIADLALLTGTIDDVEPDEMEWRTPLQVADAAERLADHLEARNPAVEFVVDTFEEWFGNGDETARDMGLEFEEGQGSWALLEPDIRNLAKIARWLAANGVPRVTFLQVL